MTKQEFLDRCAVAYDLGFFERPNIMHVLHAYDAMHRLEGGQIQYFTDFLESERQRTKNFTNMYQLANDKLGYTGIQLLHLLCHPCQKCATDPKAWHTRWGFCNHRKLTNIKKCYVKNKNTCFVFDNHKFMVMRNHNVDSINSSIAEDGDNIMTIEGTFIEEAEARELFPENKKLMYFTREDLETFQKP